MGAEHGNVPTGCFRMPPLDLRTICSERAKSGSTLDRFWIAWCLLVHYVGWTVLLSIPGWHLSRAHVTHCIRDNGERELHDLAHCIRCCSFHTCCLDSWLLLLSSSCVATEHAVSSPSLPRRSRLVLRRNLTNTQELDLLQRS